jgi:hypothetical protein
VKFPLDEIGSAKAYNSLHAKLESKTRYRIQDGGSPHLEDRKLLITFREIDLFASNFVSKCLLTASMQK